MTHINDDRGAGPTAHSTTGSSPLFSSVGRQSSGEVHRPEDHNLPNAGAGETCKVIENDPIVMVVDRYWIEKLPRLGERERGKAEDAMPKVAAIVAHHCRVGDGGFGAERFFSSVLAYESMLQDGLIANKQGKFDALRLFGIDPNPTVLLPNGKNSKVGLESMWGRLVEIGEYLRTRALLITDGQFARDVFVSRSIQMTSAWGAAQQDYNLPADMAGKGMAELELFRSRGFEIATQVDAGALTHAYLQCAELVLAEKIRGNPQAPGVPVQLSLNAMMLARNEGAIFPDFATLVAMNKALAAGGACFLFCCPDYARTQLEGGQWRYDMDGLNTGPGLTAEKAIPVLASIIARLARLSDEGELKSAGRFYVGTADFEATQPNAILTKCGTTEEFMRRLNLTVQSIARAIQEKLPLHLSVEASVSHTDTGIDRIDLDVMSRGHLVARLTLGAVTDCLKWARSTEGSASIQPFNGRADFDVRVEAQREKLVELVETNPHVQRQIDTLITLRLELLLEWVDPTHERQLKDCFEQYGGTKAGFVRAMQTALAERAEGRELNDQDTQLADILLSLRRRVVVQGAEYVVMSNLMRECPNACQLVADAANMWQVFGDKRVPRIQIRGGYSGAEVVDLS